MDLNEWDNLQIFPKNLKYIFLNVYNNLSQLYIGESGVQKVVGGRQGN